MVHYLTDKRNKAANTKHRRRLEHAYEPVTVPIFSSHLLLLRGLHANAHRGISRRARKSWHAGVGARHLREPRPTRHALLRREQRSRRRYAGRSREAQGPIDLDLRLFRRRGTASLSEGVSTVDGRDRAVHRQKGPLLLGQFADGADRGDALGPPAHRRLRDRQCRLCRQSGRRRADCRLCGRARHRGLQGGGDRARGFAPSRRWPTSRASGSHTRARLRIRATSRRAYSSPSMASFPSRTTSR